MLCFVEIGQALQAMHLLYHLIFLHMQVLADGTGHHGQLNHPRNQSLLNIKDLNEKFHDLASIYAAPLQSQTQPQRFAK